LSGDTGRSAKKNHAQVVCHQSSSIEIAATRRSGRND
jgi:hypothetical protein